MNEKKAFIVMFLLFVAIMDYPFASRIYNEHVQGKVVSDYQRAEGKRDQEESSWMLKEARNYNEALASIGEASLSEEWYHSLLNADENGVMAVISIPKIKVELPVYHGTSEAVLQKGAGHLQGSSLPIGGASTHTCISAHRGLPTKKMFTELDILEEGDLFFIRVLGDTLTYKIYEIETVTPDWTESLKIVPEEDMATLITCTPYGINTHRLYLHGKRIANESSEVPMEEKIHLETNLVREYWWLGITGLLLLWLMVLLRIMDQREGEMVKKEEFDGS